MPEKRWIVLGIDGRHATLGRHSDPSEDEIGKAEAALEAQGLSGWLAVTSGSYYGPGRLEVIQVRPLANPPGDAWTTALALFLDRRTHARGAA